MSMQMDAYLKKEQIGTLFVWAGALEGGVGGGSLRGVHPKKYTCRPKRNYLMWGCKHNIGRMSSIQLGLWGWRGRALDRFPGGERQTNYRSGMTGSEVEGVQT